MTEMFPDTSDEAERVILEAQKVLAAGFDSDEEGRRLELLAQQILAGGFRSVTLGTDNVVDLELERSKRRTD